MYIERDNVVYWKTKRKINDDLVCICIYTYVSINIFIYVYMYMYVQIYVYTLNLHIGWYCSYCGALRDRDITRG